MAAPLKFMYSPAYFDKLCPVLASSVGGFDEREFIFSVFDNNWPEMELKERVRHITRSLHHFMPEEFKPAAATLVELSGKLQAVGDYGFENIFLPDYVEVYGLDHPEVSLQALQEITKLVSAEFAIRPFILRYQETTMEHMRRWSLSTDARVRRLASEGCRPRLPWAVALPEFKKNPSPVISILQNLKCDPSLSVRKSVANNMNDIAKDNPEVVVALAREWRGVHSNTDWIVRHGCRSLLKKGHVQALALHDLSPSGKARIGDLLLSRKVKVGEYLNFSFLFINLEKRPSRFHLQYVIAYLTASGKVSNKYFMIAEKEFLPGERVMFKRKQSFRNFSTRRHFKGEHKLSIVVNGKILAAGEFKVY